MVWCHHGIERRGELLTANGAPIAPQIELLGPICAQYRSSASELLFSHSICATEGTDRIKKLEMVICEENKLIRNTTRFISLYKLLGENFIDVQRFIPKIGKFKLDETYSVFESR
jgi:hypothetical protein